MKADHSQDIKSSQGRNELREPLQRAGESRQSWQPREVEGSRTRTSKSSQGRNVVKAKTMRADASKLVEASQTTRAARSLAGPNSRSTAGLLEVDTHGEPPELNPVQTVGPMPVMRKQLERTEHRPSDARGGVPCVITGKPHSVNMLSHHASFPLCPDKPILVAPQLTTMQQ